MAHLAVIAPPLRGHYAPLQVLAGELIGRGHRVTFVHQTEARLLVEEHEAGFAELGAAQPAVESFTSPMARIRNVLDLHGTFQRMEDFTTMFCSEAPGLLRSIGADAIIADQLEPAGGMVAEHLSLPFVTVATALPINREKGVPPPFVSWNYDPSRHGIRRNIGGWNITALLLRRVGANIEANAKKLGLPPRFAIEDCFSPLLQLAQLSEALDFPRDELPPSFHYTGPWRKPQSGKFVLPDACGRPTAYASLGSLQGARVQLFRRIAQACHRAGVRLVIAHGGAGSGEFSSLPGDPLVFDWVPQDQILEQVDMVISHGGMNTTLDALRHGLPMIVIPLTFEQPGTAARVERTGAGLMISSRAHPRTLERAIRCVLDDWSFREAAKRQSAAIKASGGVGLAADLIEQALVAGAPPEASTRERAASGDVRDDIRSESR